MAAAAGALGVQLEKPGYYILGDDENPLSVTAISGALKLMLFSCGTWFMLCMIAVGVYYAVTA
jgi:adenosylcobinamide-phosphate synthase